MEVRPEKLAFELQAPLQTGALAAEMAQELWLKAKALGYTPARFKQFVCAGLQLEQYDRSLLLLAGVQEIGLLLDRLEIEAQAAHRRFPKATQQDFWRAAHKELRVTLYKALQIRDAWTINEVIDWPGAYEELLRRFGSLNQAA
jgi:hypothetical protein